MVRTRAHMVAMSLHVAAPTICITEEEALNTYYSMTLYNPALARHISSVEVRLSHPIRHLLQKLQRILRHLSHIDTLIIQIPPISVPECRTLFGSIRFPNLILFSGGTLPHKGIHQFLLRNPGIQTLILKRCVGRSDCSCPTVPSLNISEISGPSTCIAPLICGSPLLRVTATYDRESDNHISLFASFALLSANITYLSLDFAAIPRDFDILKSIAAAAPFVMSLELIQKCASGELIYPWNDAVRWANDLRSLSYLTLFSLRTSASLIERVGHKADERRLIRRWSGDAMQFPPQLRAIDLWYRLYRKSEPGLASFWKRGRLGWQRASSTAISYRTL
ncbi:hypothetical protein Hypma_003375 [Hypsizygus marmoreus]|uniref:F-box domain-containing protein n=1 Tax=Hypsizygus marmoreus TaxID=39966 RepID=A0A369J2C1_HYPMA|nr:hypothetical protein Hypma_003375 [Hypsizygus marmoreus]